mmetsp:Transcript_12024/g.18147  ORF Transcript_12024/g.18147 Transcript_12024/m.18147 type:complete len:349 (-) Transcript_12024:104-1150(-)
MEQSKCRFFNMSTASSSYNSMDDHVEECSVALASPTNINSNGDEPDSVSLADTAEARGKKKCKMSTEKICILSVFVVLVVLIVIDSSTTGYVEEGASDFLDWMKQNPILGVFAFIAIYAVATVLFIPGSILTLGAGFAFGCEFGLGIGVAMASLAVFLGAVVGSIAAFLLGRYLFRNAVEQLAERYPLFRAVNNAMETNGLKIMILLRLSPLIPYNALDYVCGITSISLTKYTLALFGMLPGVVLYCFVGATAGTVAMSTESMENHTLKLVSIVVGVVFGVLGVGTASYYARIELNKIIALQEAAEQEEEPINGNGGNDNDNSTPLTVDCSSGSTTEDDQKTDVEAPG